MKQTALQRIKEIEFCGHKTSNWFLISFEELIPYALCQDCFPENFMAVEMGRRGGLSGSKRAATLGKEKMSEIGRKAALSRWSK